MTCKLNWTFIWAWDSLYIPDGYCSSFKPFVVACMHVCAFITRCIIAFVIIMTNEDSLYVWGNGLYRVVPQKNLASLAATWKYIARQCNLNVSIYRFLKSSDSEYSFGNTKTTIAQHIKCSDKPISPMQFASPHFRFRTICLMHSFKHA